jgi:hypothetical protein
VDPWRGLQQESGCSGRQRGVEVLVDVEGGEHDDAGGQLRVGEELAGRHEAVGGGHLHVQQRHVGTVQQGLPHGCLPVADVGDDLDVVLGLQDHPQSVSDQVPVTGDEHADHGGVSLPPP